MSEFSNGGDALSGQPQYDKYIKCHTYRIHPCTFGVHSTKPCGSDSGGGGCGGDSNGGQAGHGCTGPGDPQAPGMGGAFSYSEVVTDQRPCMDFRDVCTPASYRFDMMRGNSWIDHGSIDDPAPCSIASPRGAQEALCYSLYLPEPH